MKSTYAFTSLALIAVANARLMGGYTDEVAPADTGYTAGAPADAGTYPTTTEPPAALAVDPPAEEYTSAPTPAPTEVQAQTMIDTPTPCPTTEIVNGLPDDPEEPCTPADDTPMIDIDIDIDAPAEDQTQEGEDYVDDTGLKSSASMASVAVVSMILPIVAYLL